MTSGWIKLHRKLLKWEWYDDHNTTRLFIHLLLKASHITKKWRNLIINPGEIKTSTNKLSKEIGLSIQQIRTSLEKLKSTSEITIKSTNKYTVISINSWINHQQDNKQSNKQITNGQQTSNKLTPYLKNIKNIKNNKNKVLLKSNKDKSNKHLIDILIDGFKKLTDFNPTDKKPRYEAWNLLRRIKKTYKETKREFTLKSYIIHTDSYFNWLASQSWIDHIQTMSVVRRKYDIFYQKGIKNAK